MVHADGALGRLEHFSPARRLVEPLAANLHGRIERRALPRQASQRSDRGVDLTLVRKMAQDADRDSRPVLRVGGNAQPRFRAVALGKKAQASKERRRATFRDDEEPGRERIQGAEMSDAALAVNPSYVLDDVVRRHPGGLVYEEQSLDRRVIFARTISRRFVHAPRRRPAS